MEDQPLGLFLPHRLFGGDYIFITLVSQPLGTGLLKASSGRQSAAGAAALRQDPAPDGRIQRG